MFADSTDNGASYLPALRTDWGRAQQKNILISAKGAAPERNTGVHRYDYSRKLKHIKLRTRQSLIARKFGAAVVG
ncbi:MAG TPA: hypothetical protein VM689_19145 [Aliidongia sp.]|nr:hypothetical protein [Aliidongia sp.]